MMEWCAHVLGPFQVVAERSRSHPGERSGAYRLAAASGFYYLKTHKDPAHWHHEVHAYEQWAGAFGDCAPRLVAVRDEEPLALIISEVPGRILDEHQLSPIQEQAVWRRAAEALAALHNLTTGRFFGSCRRDGRPAGMGLPDAETYMESELDGWLARGMAVGCLTDDELAIVVRARDLLPAFAGERPRPCHRDYGPANWMVTDGGQWSGVIDFEFTHWDVPIADFTRYPNWEWLDRPDLIEAFAEGYGRAFTQAEEMQRRVGHVSYALAAVVWGHESAYYGFAAEGRRALVHLGGLLG